MEREEKMVGDFEQARDQVEVIIGEILMECGIESPPVDVQAIVKKRGLVLNENVLEGRRGQNFRFRGKNFIEVDARDRRVRQNFTIAHEILEVELEKITQKSAERHRMASVFAPCLLMPSNWFQRACLDCDYDLFEVKKMFDNVSYEAAALRMLAFAPAVVTVCDNGKVTNRKTSYSFYVSRKLFDVEKQAIAQVLESGEKCFMSHEGIETVAYPIFEKEFKRIILRTLFDECAA